MKLKVYGNKLKGKINMISSKSYAHRAIICSAFSSGDKDKYIKINELSEDILASLSLLKSIGYDYEIKDDFLILKKGKLNHRVNINFSQSGSTFRFFLPILASLGMNASLDGDESLRKRPIKDLIDQLKKHGIKFSSTSFPFVMEGKLKDSSYEISADKTSQYLSGLLLAAPLIDNERPIEINLTTDLSSSAYIDITLDLMRSYGIDFEFSSGKYIIKDKEYIDNSSYENPRIIEGDWSNALFYIVGGLINGELVISNLNRDSIQADRKIVDILIDMGGDIKFKDEYLYVNKSKLYGGIIDLDQIPDSFPILAVLASQTRHGIKFTNYRRLKYKESDRIKSTLQMMDNLAGKYIYSDKYIEILPSKLISGSINSFNDHRIQMAGSIASLITGQVYIDGFNSFKKSYPSFYEDFKSLGGDYELTDR